MSKPTLKEQLNMAAVELAQARCDLAQATKENDEWERRWWKAQWDAGQISL